MSFASKHRNLPQVGDPAPAFEFQTAKGPERFPDYQEGRWCVFFAHPANFTSAWAMFSAFLSLKEKWLNERNTKVLALSNEPMRQNNDWSDKARRFIGIYLKAPVIEDLDFSIANLYGLASGRRPQPGCDRLAFIIDPQGIIRRIIHRPLANIEAALTDLEREFDRLRSGNFEDPGRLPEPEPAIEGSDATERIYKPKPAHFPRKRIYPN